MKAIIYDIEILRAEVRRGLVKIMLEESQNVSPTADDQAILGDEYRMQATL